MRFHKDDIKWVLRVLKCEGHSGVRLPVELIQNLRSETTSVCVRLTPMNTEAGISVLCAIIEHVVFLLLLK